jgi:DNA-damage-inducible protein J
MSKDSTVRARIDPELKAEVEQLFKELGLSTTEAITLFYHQVKLKHGLPFELVVPNKTTEQTFQDTDAGINLVRCDNADEMFNHLGI